MGTEDGTDTVAIFHEVEPFEKRVFSPHIELDVLKTRFSMNINGLTQLQTRQITDYNAPRN